MISDMRSQSYISSSMWVPPASFRQVWANQEKMSLISSSSSSSSLHQKPFVCQKCGKRYQSKTSLSLHTRLECGKEPMFQCHVCLRRFHQGGSLNRHVRSLHRQAFQENNYKH